MGTSHPQHPAHRGGCALLRAWLTETVRCPPRPPTASAPELFSLLGAAGVLELAGGALLALGLFTRPVAFLLSGEMAVAYWAVHAPKSFLPLVNGGDGAILYCFIFLYLVFAGPGPWSFDAAMGKRS